MKSLISEASRQKVEHPDAPKAHPVSDSTKKTRIIAAVVIFAAAGVIFLLTNPFGSEAPAPVSQQAEQKSEKMAANIRELEQADKRMAPVVNAPPPPQPGAVEPKNLRSRNR